MNGIDLTIKEGELFTVSGSDVFRLEEIRKSAPVLVFKNLLTGQKTEVSSADPGAKKYVRLLPESSLAAIKKTAISNLKSKISEKKSAIESNPYPGVSFRPGCAEKPWMGQINRAALKWCDFYETAEKARDAVNKQIKKHKLKPLREYKKSVVSSIEKTMLPQKRRGRPAPTRVERGRPPVCQLISQEEYDKKKKMELEKSSMTNAPPAAKGGMPASPHKSGRGLAEGGQNAEQRNTKYEIPSFTWDGTWECMKCDHKMTSEKRPKACEMCGGPMRQKLVAKKEN